MKNLTNIQIIFMFSEINQREKQENREESQEKQKKIATHSHEILL